MNTKIKIIPNIFMVICLITTVLPQPVFAQVLTQDNQIRKQAISDKWKELKPQYTGDPYTKESSIIAPHIAGDLQQGFREDGLNMTNFIRFLAGLPADITLDKTMNDESQHGAVVLAAGNHLSHYPKKPLGMSEAFYQKGYRSTSAGNIGYGYYTLADVVWKGYMRDEDVNNISTVGHRRWILNPRLQKIGFGFSQGKSAPYNVMKIVDTSRKQQVDYDYIGWPANKVFPTQFFQKDDPWSITLNPQKYDRTKIDNIEVILTRKKDNNSWTFSNSGSNGFFNVDNNGYGVPYSIIFRPNDISSYNVGDEYTVTVSGIYTTNGQRTTLSYDVEFFDLHAQQNSASHSIKQKTIQMQIGNKSMYVNDQQMEVDPGRDSFPILSNGRTLLPIRAVIEALGGSIQWDGKKKQVNVNLGNQEVILWIQKYNAFLTNQGIYTSTDVPPIIYNGRTYLPLRVITENLGCVVHWDSATRKIEIRY